MPQNDINTTTFFSNASERGKLIQEKNWSESALGTTDTWPDNLKSAVQMILNVPYAMCVAWGKDYVHVSNDSFWAKAEAMGAQTQQGHTMKENLENAWPNFFASLQKAFMGELVSSSESLRLDGLEKDHTFTFIPIRDSKGHIDGVMITMIEAPDEGKSDGAVAELERQLRELEASESRFRTMAESTGIMVALSDTSSSATYFNRAWSEFTGRPVEKLLKFGWADLIHPDDRDAFVSHYLESFENRTAFTGEFRMLNKSGEYRWLLAKGPPLFADDGSFHGYISSSIDITEQKNAFVALGESEEDLRNMVMTAPIGICVMDGPTRVSQIVNDSFIEVAGKPREAILGKNYWEPFAEAAPYYEQALTDVVEKGITFYANEVELMLIRHGKEEMIFVTFVYSPLKDKNGKVKKVAVWVLENTPQVVARRKIEQIVAERTKELEEANNSLRKSNSELAQFAYIASHDLQEPLRKIATFSDMLRRSLGEQLTPHSKNYLDKINSSASRMNTLIRNVLAYSELDKVNAGFETVNLNQVLQNVRSDYDLLIEQKKASITIEDLPIIEGIPLQISQLFANLLGNSLKFSRGDTAPQITVRSETLNAEGLTQYSLDPAMKFCKIIWTDNGIGLKPEFATQIFNIFQRLHRKSDFEGTGIGLAMCKKIAQNHRGDINALGSSEAGATFNIILPIYQNV